MFAKWIVDDGRFAFSLEDNGGVEITNVEYADLIDGQSNGKIIVCSDEGRPISVDPPSETQSDALARAITDVRTQRAPILDALSGIAGRASRKGDAATADAADQVAADLLAITQLQALTEAATYADMKTAVMTRYREITATAPEAVQTAFREVFAS